MKKYFLLPFLVVILGMYAKSQRSELGVFVGTAYYIGDLNPNKHFTKTNSAGGLLYRYNFNTRWAFKMSALFGQLEGSDRETNYNNDRNLSFRSPISEISGQLEFNFFNLYPQQGKNNFSPYMFIGFSAFSFNPQAQMNDHWYDLQPLGTEGQGLDDYPNKDYYSLTNVSMPFGLGLKYNFLRNFSIGIEWGMRKTWSDYIDDVGGTYADQIQLSTKRGPIVASLADRGDMPKKEEGIARGNSRTKDWYNFTGIWLSFKLFEGSESCNAYQKPKYRSGKMGKKR